MTDPKDAPNQKPGKLSLQEQLLIDALCDRLESQYQPDCMRTASVLLTECPERLRPKAIVEMVRRHAELSGEQGDTFDLGQWTQTFPMFADLIRSTPLPGHRRIKEANDNQSQTAEASDKTVVGPQDHQNPAIDVTVTGNAAGLSEKSPSMPSDETELSVLALLSTSKRSDSFGRLGHYEVLEVLGKGAFGVVLRGFDEKLHRMVAIKVMNPAIAATSPPRRRFLREARSAAAVRHENIVQIYAVEEEPVPYLIMEYIPGKTLQDFMNATGPLDASTILRFGQQIASGLAAAHAQGLIHRDIKPSNILLEDGLATRLKITDFGLARTADDASLSQSGLIAGTPMYMSPEQARGESLDQRSDLFSLGSVLYAMASGRPPFRAPNTVAVLKRVCEDTPRPIPDIQSECPGWLDEIIARLHAKSPDDRYQSASEVADTMARCLITPPAVTRRGRRTLKKSAIPISWIVGVSGVLLVLSLLILFAWKLFSRPDSAGNVAQNTTVNLTPDTTQKAGSEDSDVQSLEPAPVAEPRWVALFDGNLPSGWQQLGGFQVEDGLLVAHGGGENAISAIDYADFEFEAEWRIGPQGNGGVYYREPPTRVVGPGNEYQIADDDAYRDVNTPDRQTGSLYGVLAPVTQAANPVGDWNQTRIICRGTTVEHWLNGKKVVAYDTASADWQRRIATSSMKGKEQIGARTSGRILLQAHTADVAFRSIRIRSFEAAATESKLTSVTGQPADSSQQAATEALEPHSTDGAEPIPVLAPLAGIGSLVPRPQFIPGLKGWDIVRASPAGFCGGLERLPDGRFVTGWHSRPGVFIHRPDTRVEQFLASSLHHSGIRNLTVAPQRGLVASYGSTPKLVVTEIQSGKRVAEIQVSQHSAYRLAFSHSERFLAAGVEDGIAIYDIEAGVRADFNWRYLYLGNRKNTELLRSMVWSPDDSQMWIVTLNKQFAAYDLKDLKSPDERKPVPDHPLHGMEMSHIQLSPDKTKLMVVLASGEVRVYQTADWMIAHSWQSSLKGDVTDVAWSPDESLVAMTVTDIVEIWNVAEQRQVHVVEKVGGDLEWSADGQRVLSFRHHHGQTHWIDVGDGKAEVVRWGGAGSVYVSNTSPALISNGGRLLVVGGNSSMKEFDSEKGQLVRRSQPVSATGYHSYSRTDELVAMGNYGGTTSVRRTSDHHEVRIFAGWDPEISCHDEVLFQREQGQFVITRLTDNEVLHEFTVPTGEKILASWSPDGRKVAVRVANSATASALHIWDLNTKSLSSLLDFPSTQTKDITPTPPVWVDSDRLLVPYDGKVFDVNASDLKTSRAWPTALGTVTGLARDSKSGKTLACSNGGKCWLVDGTGRQILSNFQRRFNGPMNALHDGRRFVTSGFFYYDYPARGFDVETMQDLGCLFSYIGDEDWLTIGPTGHYQGSEGIENEILYVAEHLNDHQQTYTAEEFAKAFNWRNDPEQATFLKVVETVRVRPTTDPQPVRTVAQLKQSLRFDQTGDRVEVPQIPIDLSQPWTIETWGRLIGNANRYGRTFVNVGPVYLRAEDDTRWQGCVSRLNEVGAGVYATSVYSSIPTDEQLTHLALQWDGKNLTIYCDGVKGPQESRPWGTSDPHDLILKNLLTSTSETKLIIGTDRYQGGMGVLNGTVGAVRVSRGIRYKNDFQPQINWRPDADTIVLYDFTEGSGDVLHDISGNGYDGKIIGATWVQASREPSLTPEAE